DGGVAPGLQREVGRIAGFERLLKVQLDRNPGWWSRVHDLHASLAGFAAAVPRIDGTLAACGTAERPLHGGIRPRIGRPFGPSAKIVDERKDRLRRSLDAHRTLNAESFGLDHCTGENSENRNAGHKRYGDKNSNHRSI